MAAMKYRKFLAEWFARNPDMYNGWDVEVHDELKELTNNWENWTLRYKSRPAKGEYGFGTDKPYTIILEGTKVNRYGEAASCEQRPAKDFVWERAFDCEGTDGQIARLVMEDKEGNLYLGENIGD